MYWVNITIKKVSEEQLLHFDHNTKAMECRTFSSEQECQKPKFSSEAEHMGTLIYFLYFEETRKRGWKEKIVLKKIRRKRNQ